MDETSKVDLRGVAAQLDSDILETKRRLGELEAMRENIDPLIAYAAVSGPQPATSTKTSLTDRVVTVFLDHPTAVFDVGDVMQRLGPESQQPLSKYSVRNAIYYGVNSGRLDKRGRGRFALRDTSAPQQLADRFAQPFTDGHAVDAECAGDAGFALSGVDCGDG